MKLKRLFSYLFLCSSLVADATTEPVALEPLAVDTIYSKAIQQEDELQDQLTQDEAEAQAEVEDIPLPGSIPNMTPEPEALPALPAQEAQAAVDAIIEAAQQIKKTTEQSLTKLEEPEVPKKEEIIQSLVLVDESAKQVLTLLAQFLDKSVLQGQNLPNVKINFDSQGPISKGKAIRALESLLVLNGISVVDLGNDFIKAVSNMGINTQSPLLLETNPLDLPPSQRIYSRLFELDYLTTKQLQENRIMDFFAPGGAGGMGTSSYTLFDKSGAIFMTDTLANLQRFQRLLNKVDRMPSFTEQIRMYQLRNIRAKDAETFLNSMQQKGLKKYLDGNATFEAEERTNQLLVVAHPDHFDLIEELIERFDVDIPPFTRSNVLMIKHAEATKLATVIENIISGQQKSRKKDKEDVPHRAEDGAKAPSGNAAATGEGGVMQLSDFAGVVADERSNAIISYGNKNDLAYFKELIDQLDVVLPQVRIDVIIAEITLNDTKPRGIDVLGLKNLNLFFPEFKGTPFGIKTVGKIGDTDNAMILSTQKDLTGGPTTANGVKFSDFNEGTTKLDLVLNAITDHTDAKVLAAPTLCVMHNQEGNFFSGQKYPVVTGTARGKGDPTTQTSSVRQESIGLNLKVKPRIGNDGVIEMSITQKVEDIQKSLVKVGGDDQPVTNSRQVDTFVSVRSGDIIIVGGLQRRTVNVTKTKLPILGYLPMVGAAFSGRTDTETVSELMVFLQPKILINPQAAKEDAQQALKGHSLEEDLKFYNENRRFQPKLQGDIDAIIKQGNRSRRWQRVDAKRKAAAQKAPAAAA